MRRLILALALAWLVLVQSSVAATLPRPCSLLTNAQVSKAFAGKILSRRSQTWGSGQYASCTWTGVPVTSLYADPTPTLFLSIARVTEAQFLQNASRTSPPPVRARGIGTVATWSAISQSLDVWEHGYEASVSVEGPYVATPFATDKALVGVVFARL